MYQYFLLIFIYDQTLDGPKDKYSKVWHALRAFKHQNGTLTCARGT